MDHTGVKLEVKDQKKETDSLNQDPDLGLDPDPDHDLGQGQEGGEGQGHPPLDHQEVGVQGEVGGEGGLTLQVILDPDLGHYQYQVHQVTQLGGKSEDTRLLKLQLKF